MKAIDFLQEMNAAARSRASISLKVSLQQTHSEGGRSKADTYPAPD